MVGVVLCTMVEMVGLYVLEDVGCEGLSDKWVVVVGVGEVAAEVGAGYVDGRDVDDAGLPLVFVGVG